MGPGGVVRIRAGEYAVTPTWRVHRAGAEGRPIACRAFGDGKVRITPATSNSARRPACCRVRRTPPGDVMYADGDWKRPFNTSGIHRAFLPADWSGYDLLRAGLRNLK